ncbi:hypothetical protein GTH10_13195 [Burkholderia thailandensis]|uniref:hypothetical protein n=1 Tax=Burkholderia thailandensis TaxID=57975 RepID=UPI00148E9AF2|nr:hypothetical protein [Burkholderia thailandensis]NOK48311.1 hypothetical protein [Burkholderia thailandensis]
MEQARGTSAEKRGNNEARLGSWWKRAFGRSILQCLIGDFFSDKNNAASVVAILLVFTLCYMAAIQQRELPNGLLNIIFVVIGYYFGSKRERDSDEDS